MILSKFDAEILVYAARNRNYSTFTDVMNRADGSGDTLKSFYLGYRNANSSEQCEEKRHIECFVELIYKLSNNDPMRFLEIMNHFDKTSGALIEKYTSTIDFFSKKSEDNYNPQDIIEMLLKMGHSKNPPTPDIADILKNLFDLKKGNIFTDINAIMRHPNGSPYYISISGDTITIRGDADFQPPDDVIENILKTNIPNYSPNKYRLRRVDANGSLIVPKTVPMQPGLDEIDIDAIHVPDVVFDSFDEMLHHIRFMKK